MQVLECAKSRRTIRKFLDKPISEEVLKGYIDAARLAPSGANFQPLKYAIVQSEKMVSAVFDNVKWAGYLKGAYTPEKEERPTAYIAVFHDTAIPGTMAEFDAGAAIMTINLAAEADGIGCCIMGAIDRENICRILGTPPELKLMYIIALGYKKEHPVYVEMEQSKVEYYLENDTLHVPKRKNTEILIKIL